MSRRLTEGVVRGVPVTLELDGKTISAFAGETIATAMLAAGRDAFRTGPGAMPHGLYCNMGVCSECFITIDASPAGIRRVRACLTPLSEGLKISTRRPEAR